MQRATKAEAKGTDVVRGLTAAYSAVETLPGVFRGCKMLAICPVDLRVANQFVKALHRHHRPVVGCKFCVGLSDGSNLRGVLIAGRPVARHFDNGYTIEVNRCCTDGVKNGCSMLYGAARRAALALGFQRIITYTLPEESGVSLKASGWTFCGEAGGGSWSCDSRPREDKHPIGIKWLWQVILRTDDCGFDWRSQKNGAKPKERTLFED
jgi:hypothetical protein